MKKFVVILTVLFLAIAGPALASTITEVMDFEGLPQGPISDGYMGFEFGEHSYVFNNSGTTESGYENLGLGNVAFNAYANVFEMSSDTPFSVISGWFTPAWTTNLNLEVVGLRGNDVVNHEYYTLDFGEPQFIQFNMLDITKWAWGTHGGDPIMDIGGEGSHAAFRDLTIQRAGVGGPAPVPEPGTLLLLGSGLVGLAVYRRKKSLK